MKTTVILLVTLAFSWGHAWFINRKEHRIQNPSVPVNDECKNMSRNEPCSFYECLEERWPCGSGGYALKIGLYFCTKYTVYQDLFNPAGRTWVTALQKCLTTRMLPLYEQDRLSCKMIKSQAMSSMSDCYLENGFCDIMWENREALWKVFEYDELLDGFSALRVWREVMDVAGHCAEGRIREFVSWAARKIAILLFHG